MDDVVIRAEGLGKKYLIGHRAAREPYVALRDVIARSARSAVRSAVRKAADLVRGRPIVQGDVVEEMWALRGASFEVSRGEVVGIVGLNGAGKSTLLKILSRITEPSEGRVAIRGHVASLLEVGTGFHPELSGRENIFLNGAILGMPRTTIRRRLDEIVAFAEIERFLDTPVKRYSSGMYVRLAFAVAAHLEPEILIVDEVLAVGDANFQKKCLGKMQDVSQEGRTVLFVSHNMHAVSLLCRRAMLLESGRIVAEGPAAQVISRYLSTGGQREAEAAWAFPDAPGTERVRLRAARALGPGGNAAAVAAMDEPLVLEVDFWILRRTRMTPSFHVSNQAGVLLFAVANLNDPQWADKVYEPGQYRCACTVPANLFNEGRHFVTVFLTSDNNAGIVDVRQKEAISFEVRDRGATRGDFVREWWGLVRPVLPWTAARIGDAPAA